MSQQEQNQEQPRRKIEVDAEALHQVLHALNGEGHLIRELQATRGLEMMGLSMGTRNPINVLTDEWNKYVEKINGAEAPKESKESDGE